MNMYDVAALGELLIDFALVSTDESGYPTMAANPGGAPTNFLAAMSRFGCKTAFIGKVGNDIFGHRLEATLKGLQIDTKGLIISDEVFTTLAFVTISPSGDREFSFARKPGADMMLTVEELNYSVIDQAKVFHFGTLSMTNEPARSTTYRAVEYAKARGKLISFDPNYRQPLWDDCERAKKQIAWGLSMADVVKISDNEVEFLWGLSPENGLNKILSDYNVKLAYVTCGAGGCIYGNHSIIGRAPALNGIHPIDTTGAGDIFGGSAMAVLLGTGKRPEDLREGELEKIARYACTAAGISTERFGGISSVPSLQDVLGRMCSKKI